jgi:hypothetical protein
MTIMKKQIEQKKKYTAPTMKVAGLKYNPNLLGSSGLEPPDWHKGLG